MTDVVKKLLIGDVLQLQYAPPSENQERFAVKLVGYLPGSSLVITAPGRQGKSILVREGQSFTVRLLQGSNVFGFVSKVLAVFSRPYPHLHLTYPAEVESAVVRNAPRVSARFSTQVINTSMQVEHRHSLTATIVDLSSSGARLVVGDRLGKIGDLLQISLTLEVCSGTDRLQLLGTIRTAKEADNADGARHHIYGVQFKGMNRFQQLLLCSFVLGQIAKVRD